MKHAATLPKLTAKTALKQAQKLWGRTACVQDRKKPQILDNGAVISQRFLVGRIMLGLFFEVKGDGATWEDAFEKHYKREAADRARCDAIRNGSKNSGVISI